MRRLILSDIHANLEALNAVLADAGGAYEEIVYCGDLVGYGANPAEVIAWARENVKTIVRGNHDRACCGLEDLEWFNPSAKQAVLWTMHQLAEADLEYLRRLPAGPALEEDYELAHGAPVDEDLYLIYDLEAALLERFLQRKVCLIGHTHLQCGWRWTNGVMKRIEPPAHDERERVIETNLESVILLNPGSVGQPRDGDNRAAYALWDTEERTIRLRRVGYDIHEAQAKIVAAGLPRVLAARLTAGR